MADVFISYSRADRPRVEKLAEALGAAGISVWWDRDLEGGAEFSAETEARLNAAKAVIVVWSKTSVQSTWVADEATVGRDRKTLVPISLDGTPAKLGFRQFQVIDFSGWQGDAAAGEFLALQKAVAAKLGTAPAAPPATRPWTDRLREPRVLALVAAAVLAFVAAATLAPRLSQPAGEAQSAPSERAPAQKGVGLAVLPFASLSNDPDQEHFADGLTEELLNWLANVEGLDVPGRTTSFQYKGEGHDLREVGARLGVAYVLEGSVRRSGDALRVTAQLIEVSSGFHRWSKTYDRKLTDIFAIQDEIARLVTTELLGAIPESGVNNPAAVGDVDAKAHELYLEGRALWAVREINGSFWKFNAATEVDPGHALAQAYLAVVAVSDGARLRITGLPSGSNLQEIANAALLRAVALRPHSSDVLFAQGWMLESKFNFQMRPEAATVREAADLYEQAVRANPRSVDALFAGARFVEEPAERVSFLRRILEIDPGHLRAVQALARRYMLEGDFEAAKALYDRFYSIAPTAPRLSESIDFHEGGDLERSAEALLRDFERTELDPLGRAIQASRLADLGAVEEAADLYSRIDESAYWGPYGDAHAALLRGDRRRHLQIAAEIHAMDEPPFWSAGLVAYAHLLLSENEAAYKVLADGADDVGVVVRLDDGVGSTDHEAFIAAAALARSGRTEQAAEIWKRALNASESETEDKGWPRHMGRAIIQANLGDADTAFAELDAAYDRGFRSLFAYKCRPCVDPAFFDRNGFFQPIFDDPRFAAYVDRIRKDNAETLNRLDRKYGFLAKIRADMAAE